MTAIDAASPFTAIDRPWASPAATLATRAVYGPTDRADWLATRRTLIGGSDVAMLFGVSKYGDAFTVWADKTGRTPDRPPSVAMERGLDFEDAVVKHWAANYADFPIRTRRAGLMRSRSHPHAGATVDRLSVCTYDGQPHRCVIEVKTQNDTREWEDDQVPAAFQFQGLWQLAVTGRDHVHYVGMGDRFVPMHRIIERDDEAQALMLDRAERFWADRIEADDPPPPTAADVETVKRINYASSTGKGDTVQVSDDLAPHVHALHEAVADEHDAAERKDHAQAIIMNAMGANTELVWPDGEPAATWRAGRQIDGVNADFRRVYADLVDRYSVAVPEHRELDVAKMIENEPWLLDRGVLRRRRTFTPKAPK